MAPPTNVPPGVEDLRRKYRNLILEWEKAAADPPRANSIFRDHHALYKSMRETEQGRRAISSLLADPSSVVRSLAATHSLAWEGKRAEAVLREIVEGNHGIRSVSARYTLEAHRTGTLDLDW